MPKKILIVDDEPEIVKAVSMRLTANGYDVITAMDGQQATTMALNENPDCIVLDIGMPAGSGHVVVERLRASAKTMSTPIIFLTARTSEKDYRQALGMGVEKYITKPFDPDDLVAAVAELTGE